MSYKVVDKQYINFADNKMIETRIDNYYNGQNAH